MKTRYIYYIIILNMLSNVVAYVPVILIRHRFDGAVMSIAVGCILSTLIAMVFFKSFQVFPEQGFPEILQQHTTSWVRLTILIYFSITWFLAGFITIASYSDITVRFINPDISEWLTNLLFVLVVIFLANSTTKQVLYILEILLIVNVPLIILIFIHGLRSPYMDWTAVRQILSYAWDWPAWDTVAATTYIFTGYANMVIFHRVFTQHISLKWFPLVGVVGFLNLATTFFLPIGYHGTEGVGSYIYPWIATADSIRMELGPVERMVFIFLLLYLSISLLSTLVHWHVGLRIIQSLLPPPSSTKKKAWYPLLVLGSFGGITIVADILLNEVDLYNLSVWWLRIRLPSEIILVCLLYWIARKVKHEAKSTSSAANRR
ncbi:GerAB/ArcD/ProY family transporter [Ammoniphilus sp. YIM 78166]|uniref:GerAB/ArcD/ProY family transporter n=1 Tax=Ammoniphilus sp. YIM 78166 TaxID=1644106 RepID=UPI001070383E|nr:GerAB/ArcD/ProY family transporter [Ammoniphilus sp. YIM 78166]